MRYILTFLLLFLSYTLFAQSSYSLSLPVPNSHNTQIIHPIQSLQQKGLISFKLKKFYLTIKSSMSSSNINSTLNSDVSDAFKDFNIRNAFSYNIRVKTYIKTTKIIFGIQTGTSKSRCFYFGSYFTI